MNVTGLGSSYTPERYQREQLKARLKAIYAKAFQGLTLDKILLSYEEYVNWCLSKNVIAKDLLSWSMTVKHFSEPVLDMIRQFVDDFNETP